ncbi:MAG: hypothetical protein N2319_09750 [Candidatus Kapabacteria bacterium]|nr:hypothetical protein [Candidatus Kapabacteria bacterium]
MKTRIVYFFIIFSFIFIACKSYRIDRYLQYDTKCINCGVTGDGLLQVDIIKRIHQDSSVYLIIKNLSDETIILNDRLFTASDDGKLIMFPIGERNPYQKYSTSRTINESEIIPTYNYFLGYRTLSEIGSGRSYVIEYEPTTPIPLPPKISFYYFIKNYVYDLVYERIKKTERKLDESSNYYITDWESINRYTQKMSENTLGLHIVYKKINDSNWRSFDLLYKPINIELIEQKKLIK